MLLKNKSYIRYFNIPYDDYHDYRSSRCYEESRREDIPRQNNMPKGNDLCGYIDIYGTYYQCDPCGHERIIRKIIYENEEFRNMYFEVSSDFFANKPYGMLQEEYFAMKELGFCKVSSFKNTPNEKIVFFYDKLTYRQSAVVYPR